MKKTVLLAFTALLLAFCFTACSDQDEVDEEAANKIKEAIIAAENGEMTSGMDLDTEYFHFDEEEYSYILLTGENPLPSNESGLREAIDLVEWWCDPASQYDEDAEIAYQFVNIQLINNEFECYDFAFGFYEDGEFVWKREFAVDFDATHIFELNVNTLEYVEIYAAK